MNTRSLKALFLVLLLAGVGFAAWAKDRTPDRTDSLKSGVPRTDAVPMVGSDSGVREFELRVPNDAFALDIALSDCEADLDIVVRDGSDEIVAYSELTDYNERLFLSRIGDPALSSGNISVEVVYQYGQPPVADGERMREIPFTVEARFVTVADAPVLQPDRIVASRLEPARGMMEVFRVDVPSDARALRIDIVDTDGDLDLFAHPGRPFADPSSYDYAAQTIRSTETLVATPESVPRLLAGTHYIMVLDQVSADAPVDYSLIASFDREPPERLTGVTPLPVPSNRLERSLIATVEISTPDGGGSGCLVSSDGYILTSWHVVEAASGRPAHDITIGVSVDHTRPPVELFRAEVVDHAPERDLALLRITGGRYGEPIPGTFRFPAFTLRSHPVEVAEQLQFVGYPSIGGSGSRVSVTYTVGVVAGFQKTEYGLVIKSDGEINSGNSGGAALDAEYRLVGLPTSIIGEDAGQLAYVVPIDAIPESWRAMMGQ